MEKLSRRGFLRGTAGLAAGYVLGGCGNPEQQLIITPAESDIGINQPATAYAPAVRGEQVQVNPPPPPPQTWNSGQFIKSVYINYNGMALNYDDGPSPYNTDPVLRTLAKYGIKATFFLIGVNVIAWPEIAQRIVNEGHEVGNHSHTHSPYSAVPLANQIPINQGIIHGTVGVYPVANRAPGLTRGQIILDTCRANGMYEVHTTIDSNDWTSPRISASAIHNNVINQLHPGAFPLQHDGGNSRPTPAAQESIILSAQARGYIFNTVTGLINTGFPLPGTTGYALSTEKDLEIVQLIEPESVPASEPKSNTEDSHPEPLACNYDPEKELLRRLEDTDVKYAEKMRITEALLQIEESKAA